MSSEGERSETSDRAGSERGRHGETATANGDRREP